MNSGLNPEGPVIAFLFVCGGEYKYWGQDCDEQKGHLTFDEDSRSFIFEMNGGNLKNKENVKTAFFAIKDDALQKQFDDAVWKYLNEVLHAFVSRMQEDDAQRKIWKIWQESNKKIRLFTHWGGGPLEYVSDLERRVSDSLDRILAKSRGDKVELESFAMSSKRKQAYDLFANSRPLTKAVCEEIYHVLADFPVRDAMLQMISDWQRKQYVNGCGAGKDLGIYVCPCEINKCRREKVRQYLRRCKSGLTAWCEREQMGWVQTMLGSLLDELEKTDVENVELCGRSIALLKLLCERFELTIKCCD